MDLGTMVVVWRMFIDVDIGTLGILPVQRWIIATIATKTHDEFTY